MAKVTQLSGVNAYLMMMIMQVKLPIISLRRNHKLKSLDLSSQNVMIVLKNKNLVEERRISTTIEVSSKGWSSLGNTKLVPSSSLTFGEKSEEYGTDTPSGFGGENEKGSPRSKILEALTNLLSFECNVGSAPALLSSRNHGYMNSSA
ncbi:unnamed protein product [Citrullus colocynthis]|uniref:Uncharacterized protein n=1 Tax=Citrullus colocynthis TaxID=252529 RepID=A0ABP0Y6K6_9ROSI